LKYIHYIGLSIALLFCACTSVSTVSDDTPAGPYYEGEAGKGLRFTVLAPRGVDLTEGEQWLLSFVQGTFTSDFKKFSAMNVLDRQNLDTIIENQNLGASGYFSDDDYVQIGNLTNAQYILIGSITRIPANNTFMMDFSITDASSGEIKASFPPRSCAALELQNASILKTVSEDLLAQMGVTLTRAGKEALHRTNDNEVKADTSLAWGITEQKSGNPFGAMLNYFDAREANASLAEAATRLATVSTTTVAASGGGSLREQVAGSIQAGRDAARREAERVEQVKALIKKATGFYKAHHPFEIVPSPSFSVGNIDYRKGTADITVGMGFVPSEEEFAIIEQLKKQAESVGFPHWPYKVYFGAPSIGTMLLPAAGLLIVVLDLIEADDALHAPGIWATDVTKAGFWNDPLVTITHRVTADIINAEGRTLKRVSFPLKGYGEFKSGNMPKTFTVNPEHLTDTMTMRIVSVNGRSINSVLQSGYIKVNPVTTLTGSIK
jgi:hypothetical protein